MRRDLTTRSIILEMRDYLCGPTVVDLCTVLYTGANDDNDYDVMP